MRNFYNDANFKVDSYGHFLGDVIQMCNQMILQTYTKNIEILNEILELYRFIAEKYASSASQLQHIIALVRFLKEIWDFFIKKQDEAKTEAAAGGEDKQKEDDEINLVLQCIMRIMSHIIASLPITDIESGVSLQILEVATG